MSKKHDLPAMPFYTGDWFKCPEVRSLPLDYRALWFDMICFMWESTERGVMVKSNGKPYTNEEIVRMVGLDNQNSGIWLTYLVNHNVCSVREDGAIFSRRMVKDEKIRLIRKKIGEKGGNPKLLVNQTDKQKVNQIAENENEYEDENKDKDLISKKRSKEHQAIDKFCIKYKEMIGKEFIITNWAKQTKNMKILIKAGITALEFDICLKNFFESEVGKKSNYSLDMFIVTINNWRIDNNLEEKRWNKL